MASPRKTSDGAIFILPDGPGTRPRYRGCVDMDTLTAPGGGIDTLRRCFDPAGGWKTLGATRSPDEPVTTTLTSQVEGLRSALQELSEEGGSLIVQVREGGLPQDPQNWIEAYVLSRFFAGERSYSNIVMREDEQFGEKAVAISAFPPLYETFKRTTARQSVADANDILAIALFGTGANKGKLGYAGAAAGSGVTANVYWTKDAGGTWTAGTTDPFDADEDVGAIAGFEFGAEGNRVIAVRGTTDAGAPAEVAYSDDLGANWTAVNVGATNGQFAQGPNALYALDAYNLYLVVDGGYIYKSIDLGVTWTALESGVATSEDLYAIHMASESIGFAAGANGVVLKTEDGGDSWTAVTAITGTPTVNDVHAISADIAFVGAANGNIYKTTDGGTTWALVTFAGSGSGEVTVLKMANEMFGYMLHNTSGNLGSVFITKDGGFTWEKQSTQPNSGLTALAIRDFNEALYAGKVNDSLGYIGKVFPVSTN